MVPGVTEKEVVITLAALSVEEQIEWMLKLGAALTVTARNCYPVDANPGDIHGLMGVNEIQHRLFGRIRDLKGGHDWTIESFVRMTLEGAATYGISGEVEWALRQSLQGLNRTSQQN